MHLFASSSGCMFFCSPQEAIGILVLVFLVLLVLPALEIWLTVRNIKKSKANKDYNNQYAISIGLLVVHFVYLLAPIIGYGSFFLLVRNPSFLLVGFGRSSWFFLIMQILVSLSMKKASSAKPKHKRKKS